MRASEVPAAHSPRRLAGQGCLGHPAHRWWCAWPRRKHEEVNSPREKSRPDRTPCADRTEALSITTSMGTKCVGRSPSQRPLSPVCLSAALPLSCGLNFIQAHSDSLLPFS